MLLLEIFQKVPGIQDSYWISCRERGPRALVEEWPGAGTEIGTRLRNKVANGFEAFPQKDLCLAFEVARIQAEQPRAIRPAEVQAFDCFQRMRSVSIPERAIPQQPAKRGD